jgi:cell division protein FtsQ
VTIGLDGARRPGSTGTASTASTVGPAGAASTVGPAGAEPDEPARRRRVPRLTLVVVAATIVVLAAVTTWLVAFSSVLGVKTVTVTGERSVTAQQIVAAARVARGTPLIRLDKGAVAARVEQLPDVAAATVQTKYPSTVQITITERVAVGYVQSDSHFALVDKTGYQYRTVSTKPARLPLFQVPTGAGAQASAAAEAVVAAALPPTLLFTDSRVVQWGSADQSTLKAQILPTLLAQPGRTVDLTNPQVPFTH